MSKHRYSPLRVALIYAVVSGLWILLSDWIVLGLDLDPVRVSLIQSVKGTFFVITTAVMLFFLIRHEVEKQITTQDTLRQREERFRALIENASDIITVINEDGEIIYLSPSYERVLGYRPQDRIGENALSMIHPEDREKVRKILGQVMEQPENRMTAEYRIRHKDESWRIVESTGVNLFHIPEIEGVVINIHDVTDRVLTQQELLRARMLLRRTLDSLKDAVFVIEISDERRIITCNQAVEEVFGYQPEELIGHPTVLIHTDEQSYRRFGEIGETVLEEQGIFQTEYELSRKDGTPFIAEITVVYIEEEAGLEGGAVSVVRDITEQKRAARHQEQRLRELSLVNEVVSAATTSLREEELLGAVCQRLSEVFELPRYAAYLLDESGKNVEVVVDQSDEGQTDLQGRVFSVEDEPLVTLMSEQKRPLVITDAQEDSRLRSIQDVIAERGTRTMLSLPLIVKGDLIGIITLAASEVHVFDPVEIELAASMAGAVGQSLENAQLYEELESYSQSLERRVNQRTRSLYRLNNRLSAIFDSIGEGLAVFDPNGTFQQINPAFQRQTGYQSADLFGKPYSDLLADGNLPDDLFTSFEQTGRDDQVWRDEVVIQRKDGTIYDGAVTITPMLNAQGELEGVVANIRDVSARKEVERMTDAFISTATHELRTPLTSVLAFSELLLMRDFSNTKRDRYLRFINQGSIRLAKIIDDMLDISRLQSGRGLEIRSEPIDLEAIIEEEVALYKEVADTHRFKIVGFEDLPSVHGDDFRLGQVVRNLLSNAVKYSPEGGDITIHASVAAEEVSISVHDEGRGLTHEQQEHVFERFYRAREVENIEGTGLGLAIVKLIIERHGGTISVESEHGEGSTFTFTLPRSVDFSGV